MKNETAGELSKKAAADTTSYDALEVGHALSDDIMPHLLKAVENYRDIYDMDEFCVVMLIATDPLITNVKRRKFYCWPYLPKPRPNQAVFLYNKKLDKITKRLWVLPNPAVMAELDSMGCVDKRYQTMQFWSRAFFMGKFWPYIRHQHGIDILSETEYMSKHREELLKAGLKIPDADAVEEFDFSKIQIKKVVDPQESVSA